MSKARGSVERGSEGARWRTGFATVVVALAGFGMKFWPGPARQWVANELAGSAYVVFWCLVVGWFVTRRRVAGRIALGVAGVTCALEFTQLLRWPVLELARSTFVGRALIGDVFGWRDFPYYVVGGVLGWLLLRWLGVADQQGPSRKMM